MKAQWLELFEDLSTGDLSDEQAYDLQKTIQEDPEVGELYQQYQAAKHLIRLKTQVDQEAKIEKILTLVRSDDPSPEQSTKPSPPARIRWVRWISIAAAVGLLILIVVGVQKRKQFGNEAIAQAFLQKEVVMMDKTLGTQGTLDQLILTTSEALEARQYPEAIDGLQQLVGRFPDRLSYRMLLGKTYLKNNQPAQAIEILDSELLDNVLFDQERNWQLALAYLQLDQATTALDLCEEILRESKSKALQTKARELTQHLHSFWRISME
ncbi:MAG: tetratricopeptide repeat protein [Bacteroidota bacterium]